MNDKKIEEMLSQLITMVGGIREEQTSMKEEQASFRHELQGMKEEQVSFRHELQGMKEELNSLRDESEIRHHEIMDRLSSLEFDHELTWEKTVRNEREIGKMKKLYELEL